MEREKIAGTIMVWPGIAEELLGGKAQFVARRRLQGRRRLPLLARRRRTSASAGARAAAPGAVSVEYTFTGHERARRRRAVARPQRARRRRADGRRLELPPRAPAPLAALALRHHRRRRAAERRAARRPASGTTSARSTTRTSRRCGTSATRWPRRAAMMTGTKVTSRLLGSAWPQHMNKVVAETMFREHPEGRDAEVERGRPGVREGWCSSIVKVPRAGACSTDVGKLGGPHARRATNTGGGSDDIGDVSWTVPTVTLRYPANIPGLPGHHWASAIAMATPIAHKGVTRGREGRGDDDARPAAEAGAGAAGVGLLQERADEGREVHAAHRRDRQAGDLAEREADGAARGRR